jgi:hypothetical protein
MKKLICLAVLLILLAGCSAYRPTVDMRGVDRNEYEANLEECQKYAEKVSPGTAAVVGAGAGAAIGAVIGVIVGVAFNADVGDLAGFGAALGGFQGAVSGGAEAGMSQMEIIKKCMAGRGYVVLR